MSNKHLDPIAALYDNAAALRELAGSYTNEKPGLSALLLLIAESVTDCTAMLDDEEKETQ